MRRSACRAGWLLLGTVTSGCATLIHGPVQRIRIDSTPPGASARIDEKTIVTPDTVWLARGKPKYRVRFEKAGYCPADARIVQKDSALGWLNFAVGGFPGFILILIDSSLGGAYYLEPDHVAVTLAARLTADVQTDAPPCPDERGSEVP